MKVVSLFAGCGGLDLGFHQQGFEIVYACDSDPAAIACYKKNIDPRAYLVNVTEPSFEQSLRSIKSCDVVLGGFPCQGFSKAGPKSESDPRNQLYLKMKWCIEKLRPSIFVAENVDGLSQNFGGRFLECILNDFSSLGYTVDYRIVNAVAFGVPQYRRRILFVGLLKGINEPFQWPDGDFESRDRNGEFSINTDYSPLFSRNKSKPRTIADAISDLIELNDHIPDHKISTQWPEKYKLIFGRIGPGQKLCNSRHADTSVKSWDIPEVFGSVSAKEVKVLEVISRNRRHRKYGSIPNGNPLSVEVISSLTGYDEVQETLNVLVKKNYLKKVGEKFDLKGAMFNSGLFKRPNWNEPAPTILTNFYNPRYFLHPTQDRPFSLRECARLQGFPDDFEFMSAGISMVEGYRLVGNAVPPPLAASMAGKVKEILRPSDSRNRFPLRRKKGIVTSSVDAGP